ncbi:lung seven transmembrane receptor-domain-containing protein [Pisolithus orientalis]|uniref:lung seven transmembrane receptor-domain-containing protein n=1 Tax=Pisolithus orientalis TaxID=936130 RepID=UPI0022242634|nr:lung seven transmembrane receptor-domain-containing protein [Pisolithus orientalis]KAI6012488.1 lung seven transmembrane receptor-domain-containing protein [Pisolithus orientalis]
MRQYSSHGRLALLALLSAASAVAGYEVTFADSDYSRQVCSGMWGDSNTYINVTFDPRTSYGQVAMAIYEWKDVKYLGAVTSESDDSLPQKTYVCTTDAVTSGLCLYQDIGKFIYSSDDGTPMNQTSFWTASVTLDQVVSSHKQQDKRGGIASIQTHPIARQESETLNPSPAGTLTYTGPIQYQVRKTGYYCVAIVPVTIIPPTTRQVSSDTPSHPTYSGVVLFQNTFDGQLPAADYPKVNFYLSMFFAYALLGCAWAWLCYRHMTELLPIQYYLSGLVAFMIVEMAANWVYYRYLNAHGKNTASIVFLFVVAILDAGRNALSFFMLLVVSLGLSVVRETLGRTMIKCQTLAAAHFVFGVLYAVGIVELSLESTSALVLLLFVIPLAFTLSGFLMWILHSLTGTMNQLAARKQRYKLKMFQRLYYILLGAVVVIAIFFVVSSYSFSDRLAEDYAAKSWRARWWLLDGYLALLFFVAFWSIAYLWRPTENNRRLAMSDEIAQEDEDAEDYDLEALQDRTAAREDDEITLVNNRREPDPLAENHVVFEIGDEDAGSDDESDATKKRRGGERKSVEELEGSTDEREGLMGGRSRNRND